jgi:hypothetical protein
MILLTIMALILAVIVGFINMRVALWETTLEGRVASLMTVVVTDVIMLIMWIIWIGDPMASTFLAFKYLFFAAVDFNKTLRQGL